jgi:hypothetical protein
MQTNLPPCKKLLVVGDSQVGDHWRWIEDHALLPELEIERCNVDGATASGTVNGALPVFHERVEDLAFDQFVAFIDEHRSDDALLCVVLGTVDCHVWSWTDALRTGRPQPKLLDESFTRFEHWCSTALEQRFSPARILITGAVVPPLKDENRPQVRHLRMRNVRATQLELTTQTLAFNVRLRAMAERRGYPYAEITGPTYDPDTGLVRPRYCAEDPLEHHLSTPMTVDLWCERIRRVLAGDVLAV